MLRKLGTYYVNKIMVPETFLKLAGYETKPGNGVTVSMKKEGFIEGCLSCKTNSNTACSVKSKQKTNRAKIELYLV